MGHDRRRAWPQAPPQPEPPHVHDAAEVEEAHLDEFGLHAFHGLPTMGRRQDNDAARRPDKRRGPGDGLSVPCQLAKRRMPEPTTRSTRPPAARIQVVRP